MEMSSGGPSDAQQLFSEGFALHRSGQLEEAAARYRRAVDQHPDHFDALHLLGAIYARTGRPSDAAALLGRAIRINPNVAQAYFALGMALSQLRRPEEALANFDRAIALSPGLMQAHYNRALQLTELGRLEEAVSSYDQTVALAPDSVNAWFNRGVLLQDLGRLAEAVASFDAVIRLTPNDVDAHNRRGVVLNALGRPEEALDSYERAIALSPALAEAHYNCGIALHELTRVEEAIASFEAAVALRPDYAEAHVNLAFSLLVAGRFEAGWREHEWRKRLWGEAARMFDAKRLWTGEPGLEGKTLFVHHEQGLGDTIQFCRYAKLLNETGARLILSVHAPLKPLLRQLGPAVEVIGDDEPAPAFDHFSPLLSLPLACGTTLESIPSHPRYIWADADQRSRFEDRLGPRVRPRIGLAWSGDPGHMNDRNRSIAFEQLGPLLTDNADWICLQNAVRPADSAALARHGGVSFHGDALADFSDAAALVDHMDLVITVDTSLAHLAGAMGKPVWILLPFAPDWRWLLGRSDSPWYPSARLFRQPRRGDWSSVIEAVRAELRAFV
jgi:tetratricopeptide (TPR) repeat protein